MSELKPYMGYDEVAGAQEGAILIFAHNAREAKKVAYPTLRSLFDSDWVDARAKRLKEHTDYLEQQAHVEKLIAGVPHVIDNPKVCPSCELWGGGEPDENGRCDLCYGEEG